MILFNSQTLTRVQGSALQNPLEKCPSSLSYVEIYLCILIFFLLMEIQVGLRLSLTTTSLLRSSFPKVKQ